MMNYLFKTTKKYRVQFFLLFLTVIFSTVTGALFPYAIGKIVDEIFYKQQMKGFLVSFFLYAGLYFLNQCLHGGLNYLWIQLKITYVVDIRKDMFQHLMKLKADIWTHMKSGDVMKRIMEDTECFLEFIHRSLFYILANFIQLAISIGYLISTNVWLGLVAIVMTPVMAYSVRYFTTKLKEKHQQIRKEKGLVDAWILEMMAGMTQWKLLNAHEKVGRDYQSKTEYIIGEEIKVGYLDLKSGNINEALTLVGRLSIYCVAAFCIAKGSVTVGQFVACAAYFSTCAAYYNSLSKKITDIGSNLAGIKRVEEFMTWKEEEDLPSASDRTIRNGAVSFEDVSFGYGEEIVLKGLNLRIGGGEKIAFVGKSGEGKSTLLQLLCRFYAPLSGKICIDDIPLTEYTLSSLRSQIAVVQQDNGLFHGSLRKNIILSDEKSTDDRIWDILEGLKLKELAEELPEGLDTIVGSGGRELSGGQKQRIAIARCVFRQPKVLLLDEATSALDAETEQIVYKFLYARLPHATILSVAHRFSAVLSAEKIVVMEHGCVADMGSHEDLIQRSTLYQVLYSKYKQDAQLLG
ncbi:MAG: ABC transporter ATP-binding protein/permease [Acetatifactor sp.]|nr:ABC transporter ATP-binding protein/permease [Acetatifactor sp.]